MNCYSEFDYNIIEAYGETLVYLRLKDFTIIIIIIILLNIKFIQFLLTPHPVKKLKIRAT